MSLSKSYRLINFLNRERGRPVRLFLAGLGWLGALACSADITLAGHLARDFRHGSLKTAFRRAGWLGKTSWLKASLVRDPYFIFSEGMTITEADSYLAYLNRRKKALADAEYYSSYLMLLGQKIHQLIQQHQHEIYGPSGDHPASSLIAEFQRIKQNLLQHPLPAAKASRKKPAADRDGDFSKEDAQAALRDFAQLLPLSEYPWYVISGTFLGMHRDGGFMAHDYDIDLGLNYEQTDMAKLEQRLQQQTCFAVKKTDYSLEVVQDNGQLRLERQPALIKLIHNSGINVDIFIHHLDGSKRWHGSSIHRWDNTEYELIPGMLEGIEVLQPANADLYLAENYGDWRTPVKEFDCSTGTPNLTITHNFLSHALFLKRMLIHQEGGAGYNEAIKAQLASNSPMKINNR